VFRTLGSAQEPFSLATVGLGLAMCRVMRRQDAIHPLSLQSLFSKHPYILIFQKENWQEYLDLLSQIYDLVEENGQQVPYVTIRILVMKYFRNKGLQSVEQTSSLFISMCIEELQVLKDVYDKEGQRLIELTRSGKQLLSLVEQLLSQRIKYSGTGAETLLGALNEALIAGQGFDQETALSHHQGKIKAYREDIKKIESLGVQHAELLPVPHSVEALFAQAEGAAEDILAAVEDVKQAIESERQELAQSYLDSTRSSGQSVNAVAEFYEQLHQSATYRSYIQAKDIFSYLEAYAHRFPFKNVSKILHKLEEEAKVEGELIKRSQLNGFQKRFELADSAILDKIQAQLRLLELQVRYSLATDVKGLQVHLKELLRLNFQLKDQIADFFEEHDLPVYKPSLQAGGVELFSFERSEEIENDLIEEDFGESERRLLIEALLQAEETTLKQIISHFRTLLLENGSIRLDDYSFRYGLAEYYVLSEVELFDQSIQKEALPSRDLVLTLRGRQMVMRGADIYALSFRGDYGSHAGLKN